MRLSVDYGDSSKSVELSDDALLDVVGPPRRGELADRRVTFTLRESPSLRTIAGLSLTEPPHRELVVQVRENSVMVVPLELGLAALLRLVVREGARTAEFPLAGAVGVSLA